MSLRTARKNIVNRAVMFALATTSVTTVQVFAEEGVEEVERIAVTGSRINRTDIESASPVTVISSDFIAQSGFTSVQEILSMQPAAAGMSLGATSNNGSGGSATVNLRGMGTQRTLVLMNGRRMVASGTGADSSVDLNTIPVSMIQSIEILKDGASAVYGSDAIAGVVNIITKKDYVGTEITADGSITDKGDGESGGLSILHGSEVAGGNLVVGLQYSNRGEIIQSDRDFVPAGESSYVPEGSLGGMVPDKENGGWKERDTSYDYTDDSYAQTPNELFSLFSSFNTEIADDTELSFDLMYTRRESNQQMAPQPAAIDLAVCLPGEANIGNCIDEKHTGQFVDEDGNLPDELLYKRRMTDAGPRIYEQTTDTYRASIGLTGFLSNDSQWDMSATYGRNDSKDSVGNSIHAGNMEQSIYLNQDEWFSGDPMNSDFLASEGIMYTEQNEGGNEQFILAAGYSGVNQYDLGYAVGVESRFESGYYTPDLITQAGESTAAQQDPTEGNYSVQSIYGEISLPVTDAFTVEAATRYDNYSTFGGAATWKLGATYSITDGLMLRAVAATGFRAPSVSELYGGDSGSFDYLTDPWGREEDEQIKVNYTSDADLQPEESESFTAGVVWEVAEGLSTTMDYWKFDITNAISRVNVQNEMGQCFSGTNPASCETINITPGGDLSDMTSTLTNIGQQNTSGIDWNISYANDMFKVQLDTTYLLEFEEDGISYEGTIDGNMGGYSQLKSNLTVSTELTDDLTLLYTANYIQGMEGNAWGDEYATDDVIYHNVSAAYHINDDWQVTGGIKNLLDTEPEEVPDGNDMNTVPNIYDVVGRTFFINTSYKF
ncbi:TonB-dependent receptor plug domain-containing protein [Colwellia sp. 12G3]|uniref:TonB-dependent receptor plug domain-containing protein n=1 Tax=Colwellia sp. 12G3 TaxID=2058299 RepID=UPI000C326B3C|nr:TonB-dependent receptor [Colwellia sp. 12G3]PKI16434.1 TonB-dependent receptor [Colwellia sp. 12G3]